MHVRRITCKAVDMVVPSNIQVLLDADACVDLVLFDVRVLVHDHFVSRHGLVPCVSNKKPTLTIARVGC